MVKSHALTSLAVGCKWPVITLTDADLEVVDEIFRQRQQHK